MLVDLRSVLVRYDELRMSMANHAKRACAMNKEKKKMSRDMNNRTLKSRKLRDSSVAARGCWSLESTNSLSKY